MPTPEVLSEHRPLEAAPRTDGREQGWELEVAPYLWLASVYGSVIVDGERVDVEDGGDGFFGDPALAGFMAYVEARRGRWSLAIDEAFVDADFEPGAPGLLDGAASISGLVLQGELGYDLGAELRARAGLRYCSLETELALELVGQPLLETRDSATWVDPFVGLGWRHALSESAALRASADLGGFGVGSDLAWASSVALDWRFAEHMSAFLGYRGLGMTFREGGSDGVEYRLRMLGPTVGLRLSL